MDLQPVIDSHTHPMVSEKQQVGLDPHPPEDYLRRVAGRNVVLAAALVMAPRHDLETTRSLNDLVLELGRDEGSIFFPVCSVHPLDGEPALEELERVAGLGARWLKLHPNTQDFDVADQQVARVVARATELKMPVLFDAYSPFDPAQPGKFIRLAMEVPDARLILAHAHGPGFGELVVYEILARYPWWPRRVYVDISATASLLAGGPYQEQFLWVLRKVGMDRVLFGSDYPLDDPGRALDSVLQMGFTDEELRLLLHDNAASLLAPGPG